MNGTFITIYLPLWVKNKISNLKIKVYLLFWKCKKASVRYLHEDPDGKMKLF